MFQIECPWCGNREQSEFAHGGEAGLVRPAVNGEGSAPETSEYLFFRTNPRGVHSERWFHVFGCRRWFYVARDTVTNELHGSCSPGDAGTNPDGKASNA